jgi:hypothetical protein
METTLDPAPAIRKPKAPSLAKLPKLKQPPASVMNAVVKRAEKKTTLAKFSEKTAPLLEARREKELAARRAAAKNGKAPVKTDVSKEKVHWDHRKSPIYMAAAREICARHLRPNDAVLDVGSNRTSTLSWHRKKARRMVSIDPRNPYRGQGVESVAADFLDYPAEQHFELVTCLQVLQHVRDAHAFAQKLLAMGDTCVVSVPYKWPKGKCKWHLHDPIDELKLLGWFGKQPLERFIAREDGRDSDRLVHVYAGHPPPAPAGKPTATKGGLAALAAKLGLRRPD